MRHFKICDINIVKMLYNANASCKRGRWRTGLTFKSSMPSMTERSRNRVRTDVKRLLNLCPQEVSDSGRGERGIEVCI